MSVEEFQAKVAALITAAQFNCQDKEDNGHTTVSDIWDEVAGDLMSVRGTLSQLATHNQR